MRQFRNISEDEIRAFVPMTEAIRLMREAFVAMSCQDTVVPLRSVIDIPKYEARALFMPVYLPRSEVFGIKIVSVFPNNSKYNFANIHGKFMLFDAQNGLPLALMDAEYLTALRTGAAAGLATDLLAKPESKALAIFGTGTQAFPQVQAVCAVRPIEKVLVFGTSVEKSKRFAEKIKNKLGVECNTAQTEDLLGADIICTATNAKTPVFQAQHVKPGCHINAIGSFKPDMQEIPAEIVQQAKIVVDQRQAALVEAGDIIIPMQKGLITENQIYAELGEIADDRILGRTTEDGITLFKSVGNAVQDLVIAHYIFEKLSDI